MEILKRYRIYILFVNRIILGVVFLFSGLVKSIDPMGTSIKIGEYLHSFSLESLDVLTPYLSILLCGFELFLGLMLLMNLQKHFISQLTMLTMLFFTAFTAYIFIESPVSDCGCFGDAIRLTNTETLLKNIVLLLLSLSLFLESYGRQTSNRFATIDTIYTFATMVVAWGVPAQASFTVPAVDFLPYSIGVNINEASTTPQDAPKDQFEITLVYKNIASGKLVEFSDSDTTWYDSSKWEYIDTKTKLTKKGHSPAISSFDILDHTGKSIADKVLAENRVALLVVYDAFSLNSFSKEQLERWSDLERIPDTKIAVITSDNTDKISSKLKFMFGRNFSVYSVDGVQLKSMLRSSVGVIILENGAIKSKTTLRSTPYIEQYDDLTAFFNSESEKKPIYISIIAGIFILLMASHITIKLANNEKIL